VKRRELIKKIEKQGAMLIRHGGKHDWYQNPETRICQPVPRHSEINENGSQYSAQAEQTVNHCELAEFHFRGAAAQCLQGDHR